MTEAVTLHDGYYLIDTRAWLEQRIGAHHDDRSAHLRDFTRSEVFDRYHPAIDIAGRTQLWCAAHHLMVGDGALLAHDDSCLTQAVTIVLATTSGGLREALALIRIDGAAPQVYADCTTDQGYWRDTETITITCPDGHYGTWDGSSHLHTVDGSGHQADDLFGVGAPVISRCRDCAAFDDDATEDRCGCPGVAVYCPVCDQRCQVGLPEVPTFGQIR